MIRAIGRFGRFWYDFVVGDDAFVAIGVLVAIILTDLAARVTGAAWLVMPLSVAAILAVSIGRAQRRARDHS